jgi:hypothetical protein
MATTTFTQGTRSSAVLALGTLASATYVTSSAIDLGASIPFDVVFEVECNPNGTPSGNKQLVLFAKLSLDNTNYGSGPESGTTATGEADLHLIGVLPTNDTNDHRKFFSLRDAGVPITRYLKLVAKNDMGVALTSGNVYQANITATTA